MPVRNRGLAMSTSTVTPNTETGSLGAALVATDGCFFSLNEAYASPGLIVATVGAERAQGPVRHATLQDAAAIDAMLRDMHQESPIYRAMPIDDRKLADYIAQVIASSGHAVLLPERAAAIAGIYIG